MRFLSRSACTCSGNNIGATGRALSVAVVTGGSSGIGYAIASELISLGATVVITGRDKKKAEAAYNELDCLDYWVGDLTTDADDEQVA